MIREERDNAAEVLENMLSDIADNKLYGIKRDEINAILRSIVVLRDYDSKPAQHEQVNPTTQPDPDTGLVPCGCGGKAKFRFGMDWKGRPDDSCFVICEECGEQSGTVCGECIARHFWNRAMGWREKE